MRTGWTGTGGISEGLIGTNSWSVDLGVGRVAM